ncbi:MAG TPA: DUF4388 domain-containing protein [Pyrinomonadaceae bacterium]|nr:DUF4388 domain-containing protein [Pyrinomonadaceae bacterium]
MSIKGTLKTMNVSDLLQFLAAGRKTGTLKVARGTIVKEIVLENGVIVGSRSNDPKELIGQVLLHYGKIGEEQLQAAMGVHRQSGDRLGSILSAQGVVSAADVVYALRTRTLEIIYDLFLWEEADFEFFDDQALPSDVIRIQVEAQAVIMEGIYRLDEWARYRTLIPSDRTVFELSAGWTKSLPESKEVREALYHVEKGMTVAEICYNMHTSLFHACAVLFDLIDSGVIAVAGEAVIPEPESQARMPLSVAELLELARAELQDGSAENALTRIRSVLEEEPNNSDAQELRQQAEERYARQVYQDGLPQSAVPKLLKTGAQLETEQLDPREAFLLSRINGEWDIAAIIAVCPFREADSLRMIKRLIDGKVVGLS